MVVCLKIFELMNYICIVIDFMLGFDEFKLRNIFYNIKFMLYNMLYLGYFELVDHLIILKMKSVLGKFIKLLILYNSSSR